MVQKTDDSANTWTRVYAFFQWYATFQNLYQKQNTKCLHVKDQVAR